MYIWMLYCDCWMSIRWKINQYRVRYHNATTHSLSISCKRWISQSCFTFRPNLEILIQVFIVFIINYCLSQLQKEAMKVVFLTRLDGNSRRTSRIRAAMENYAELTKNKRIHIDLHGNADERHLEYWVMRGSIMTGSIQQRPKLLWKIETLNIEVFSNKKINRKACLSSENDEIDNNEKACLYCKKVVSRFEYQKCEHFAKISILSISATIRPIIKIFDVLNSRCAPLSFFIIGFSILPVGSIPVIESK